MHIRRLLLKCRFQSICDIIVFLSIFDVFDVSMCLFNGDCVVYVLTFVKSSSKMEKKDKDKKSGEKSGTPR